MGSMTVASKEGSQNCYRQCLCRSYQAYFGKTWVEHYTAVGCMQTKVATFNSLKKSATQCLPNLFIKNSACTSRNHHNTNTDVRLPRMNTTQEQTGFSFRDAKAWNSLPIKATLIYSLQRFKKIILRLDIGS